ncbi:dihydrofolate reductase family protein [Kribbella sp. NPDC056861]|uniref:dihydrofolate reductase family protein n=1 Tax=Kribbella sp. NPDC056861 TaxID=3154857 RepID=UPI003435AE53
MTRLVTANLNLSLDGHYNGPGGAGDLGAIIPFATTDVARDQMTRLYENATTAVLGRLNAEGFLGFWPSVADNEDADPRDRGYARWIRDTEKVVFSTTLTESPWAHTRLVNAPAADVITDLKTTDGGEILVNSSASVIKALLAADLLDRLYLMITPVITGGGQRLFEDGLPATRWGVAHQETGKLGELAIVYDRLR